MSPNPPKPPPRPGRNEPGSKPEDAALVVLLALLGVGQDRVRLLDLLEALLGLLVARVLVRVVLARELAVGLLDLLGGGLLVDAERLVWIALRRASGRRPPPARDAARSRSACSPSRRHRARAPASPSSRVESASWHSGSNSSPGRVERLDALALERGDELRVHHPNTVGEVLLVVAGRGERALEVVEHRQQLANQVRLGPLARLRGLTGRALAEVVEAPHACAARGRGTRRARARPWRGAPRVGSDASLGLLDRSRDLLGRPRAA